MIASAYKHAPKVLVVDDDSDILRAFDIILTDEGYNVVLTKRGEDVEDLIRNTEDFPDVIILDILLAGKNGCRIANMLKNHETTRHIPIIMISAYSRGEGVLAGCKADCFVSKPFAVESMLRLVNQYTQQRYLGKRYAKKRTEQTVFCG